MTPKEVRVFCVNGDVVVVVRGRGRGRDSSSSESYHWKKSHSGGDEGQLQKYRPWFAVLRLTFRRRGFRGTVQKPGGFFFFKLG